MTNKKWRRNLGKEIRRSTGLPLPVAMRLAKGVIKSGASGFHFDHNDAESGSIRRLAADSIQMESVESGCLCCGWRIDAIFAEGPRGRYYFEGAPSK